MKINATTALWPVLGALGFLAACDKGTLADPKTIVKSDLNPPSGAVSLTSGSSFNVIWEINNTETDLVGYNIYVAKTKLSTLAAKITDSTLKTFDLSRQGIPRCDGTKDLFATFGFSTTDKQATVSCSKAGVEESTAKLTDSSNGMGLADETPIASKFVKCYAVDSSGVYTDIGSSTLSVDIKKAVGPSSTAGTTPLFGSDTDVKKRVGARLKCRIPNALDTSGKNVSTGTKTTLSDGNSGITAGETYVAWVVAVQGDKATKFSWSSNFVEDIPTEYRSYTTGGTYSGITLAANKYRTLTFSRTGGVATAELTGETTDVTTESDCPTNTDTANNPCRLYRTVTTTLSGQSGVFLAEDSQNTGSERVFFSGVKDNTYLTKRNPRPKVDGNSGVYFPGDSAVAYKDCSASTTCSDQYVSGLALAAYPGDLFDIAVKTTSGSTSVWNYGKAYFESITTDGTDGTGKKTISLWLAVQKVQGSLYYLTDVLGLAGVPH